MALMLFVGYLILFIWNMAHRGRDEKMPLKWPQATGILVQFGWEAGLSLGGVRSAGFGMADKLRPLILNSLLETNLGMPYIYFIYLAYAARFRETMKCRDRRLTFTEALRENNRASVRGK